MPIIPTILFAAAFGLNIYGIILTIRIRTKHGLPSIFRMTIDDHLKPTDNEDYKEEIKKWSGRLKFWIYALLLLFFLSIIFKLP